LTYQGQGQKSKVKDHQVHLATVQWSKLHWSRLQ